MTYERAIILLSQMYLPCFDEEEKEALDLAINTLSDKTTKPYITCPKCGKRYRRQIEEQSYDAENNLNEYYCYCPYCGEEYEWNDCYWR